MDPATRLAVKEDVSVQLVVLGEVIEKAVDKACLANKAELNKLKKEMETLDTDRNNWRTKYYSLKSKLTALLSSPDDNDNPSMAGEEVVVSDCSGESSRTVPSTLEQNVKNEESNVTNRSTPLVIDGNDDENEGYSSEDDNDAGNESENNNYDKSDGVNDSDGNDDNDEDYEVDEDESKLPQKKKGKQMNVKLPFQPYLLYPQIMMVKKSLKAIPGKHYYIIRKDGKDNVVCKCGKYYANTTNLNKHIKNVHSISIKKA